MKYQKIIPVLLFATLTQAMKCDNDMDDVEPLYPKNAKGIPEYRWLVTIGAESFQKNVVGRGWKFDEAYRITEEGWTEKFYPLNGDGYPAEYYFTTDSVVKFTYTERENIRQTAVYHYDMQENLVGSPLIEYMQLCRLDSTSMEVVEYSAPHGYCVSHYKPMMPFELNARIIGSQLAGEASRSAKEDF